MFKAAQGHNPKYLTTLGGRMDYMVWELRGFWWFKKYWPVASFFSSEDALIYMAEATAK